jgi:4-amino-4-deoxy-L-arabinose transferase-like glycosyltransferase
MKNIYLIILVCIFICHLFFRFYNLEKWANFGYDQVNNAWAAHRIIIEGKYPLVGFEAKGNSGMYIGPLYYYLVAFVYYLTVLNPVASPIIAAITGVMSFFVIYFVSKRIFNDNVALVSCAIYTFSSFIIRTERLQGAVNFIAPVSLLIYYFLYKVITGELKYLPALALMTGLSFHIHFTSIFYPVIILLTLPLVPRSKNIRKYILWSIPLFFTAFAGQILYYFQPGKSDSMQKYTGYFQTYYHGLHLRRFMQLAYDAFIKFEQILGTPYSYLRNTVFFYIPVFAIFYGLRDKAKNSAKLLYITVLWILVPWLGFATYRGEISDYYFSFHLYLAVIIFAYLTVWMWNRKQIITRLALIVFWMYWGTANTASFMKTPDGNLLNDKKIVKQMISLGQKKEFSEGDPQSYWYDYLLYR